MNDKNNWSKSSIPINDEPLIEEKEDKEQLGQGIFQDNKDDIETEDVEKKSANIKIEELPPKEEMEQLEQGTFQDKKTKDVEKKSANIKIEELPPKKVIQSEHKIKTKTRLKKYIKRLCLIAVFIIAGVVGFYLSFSWSLHSQSEQNAKENDIKQLELRQQKLSEQQSDLENELTRLEKEKEQLSKQYGEATQEKSFLVEMLDKIMGKDEENKAVAENLQMRISKLEQILHDINLQLDGLESVETKVHDLKVIAEQELTEHKDIIDMVKFQAQNIINDFWHK